MEHKPKKPKTPRWKIALGSVLIVATWPTMAAAIAAEAVLGQSEMLIVGAGLVAVMFVLAALLYTDNA